MIQIQRALKPFERRDPTSKALKLDFRIERRAKSLAFEFELKTSQAEGFAELVLPRELLPAQRQRKPELWRKTCFELFVAHPSPAQSAARGASVADTPWDEAYLEMNLSPVGHWNLYAFDSTRTGMREVSDVRQPLGLVDDFNSETRRRWVGEIVSDGSGELARFLAAGPLVIGATAVLEYSSGEREYWALAHSGLKPDFHLRDSFVIWLNPAPSR
jgi:hypothetical protein